MEKRQEAWETVADPILGSREQSDLSEAFRMIIWVICPNSLGAARQITILGTLIGRPDPPTIYQKTQEQHALSRDRAGDGRTPEEEGRAARLGSRFPFPGPP